MATVSLRLSEEENDLFKRYADIKNMSLSDMMRKAVVEKIEDEYDLSAYNRALAAHKANPVTYTLDEVEESLGLK
jgi:uncharacterized protein (DUF1778 family)